MVQFTWPPPGVQRTLFALIAPLAKLLGYRGNYPEYLARGPSGYVPVEPLAPLRPGSPPASSFVVTS